MMSQYESMQQPQNGGNGGHENSAGSERSFPGGTSDFVTVDPKSTHETRHVIDAGEHPSMGSAKAEFNDAQYVKDLRGAFSSVPRPKARWQDRYMKLMIVGETGQGKTTFIKNMFASYAQDADLKINDVSAPTSKDEFVHSPEKLCTEIIVSDPTTQTRYHYKVQDTPGYDSMEVNMDPILQYIHACNEKALARDQDAKRTTPLASDDDPRVDICIYFLSPHRIKPIDLKFMTELSALVPLVPVLAKADSMTTNELDDFRKGVREALVQASKNAKRQVPFQFSEEALQEAGARPGVPPFAIVASNTMDMSVGRFWPIRSYDWGNCEALSSRHSDLSALKKLLFEVMFEELKEHTEQRYHKFRQNTLFNLDDPNRPVHRSTLAEQLQRTLRMPQQKSGLGRLLGKFARTALSGIAVYVVVNVLSGKTGQKRLRQDVAILTDKTAQAAEVVTEKATDAGEVVLAKSKDVAGDLKNSVFHDAEAERRRQEAEEEAKKGKGPFGLFGRQK